jgi:hypothetical protein
VSKKECDEDGEEKKRGTERKKETKQGVSIFYLDALSAERSLNSLASPLALVWSGRVEFVADANDEETGPFLRRRSCTPLRRLSSISTVIFQSTQAV